MHHRSRRQPRREAPTTIREALGLPVLGIRFTDTPDVVDPGQSALLSGERNIDEWDANITRLLTDQDRWPQMGTTGSHHVETLHDVDKEIPRLESIYSSLIEVNG